LTSKTYSLREIAPPAPAPANKAPVGEQVWLLNLDQIEPHTGSLLSKEYVQRSALGTSTHAFDDGNVLYSKLRPYLNKVLLPDAAGYCTTELVPLRPNQRLVTREYLAAYLRSPSFLAWVSQQVDGAKMPRVSMKVLWEHRVELPTLDEQRQITCILDKANSLRFKRQQAIRLADDFVHSLFFTTFGDVDANLHCWEVVRLEDLALQVTDGEHQTPRRSDDGIKLLSARNVQNGFLALADVDHVPAEEFERIRRRCEPHRGDVLISCSGTIGRVASVSTDEPMALVRSVALVRPDTRHVLTSFLEHYLRSASMQRRMTAASKSSAQANLFQGPIRALPVLLPPMSLQFDFEKRLLSMQSWSQKAADSAETIRDLGKSLHGKYFGLGASL
jgi:type I restriction enzyme S subunit